MKTKTFAALMVGLLALPVLAQEHSTRAGLFLPNEAYLDWDKPEWWQRVAKRSNSAIPLGSSHYFIQGPVVETFRLPQRWSDRSLGEKIVTLPVLSLFIPQPMPAPPAERVGNYFAWGDRDLAWSTLADRPIPGPQATLLSVSR